MRAVLLICFSGLQSKMKKIYFAFITLALIGFAVAEGTRQWKETGYEEFERGATRGVAIRSTGQLELRRLSRY